MYFRCSEKCVIRHYYEASQKDCKTVFIFLKVHTIIHVLLEIFVFLPNTYFLETFWLNDSVSKLICVFSQLYFYNDHVALDSNLYCERYHHMRNKMRHNLLVFFIFIHTLVWYVLPLPIYSHHRRSSPLLIQILPLQHHDWRPKSLLPYFYT